MKQQQDKVTVLISEIDDGLDSNDATQLIVLGIGTTNHKVGEVVRH